MSATETGRLLKADNVRHLGTKVAFNYEDLRQRCDKYIEQIRAQAKQILTDAQLQAEGVRKRAEQQGHEVGLVAGREQGLKNQHAAIDAAAEQKAIAQLKTTLPAIAAAVDALKIERNRWLTTWQNTAIHLSVAIAEKLLHHELSQRPELAKEAIVEALELAAGNPQIQLRMNPQDIEHLGTWYQETVSTNSPAGAT